MRNMWSQDPDDRPTIQQVFTQLCEIAGVDSQRSNSDADQNLYNNFYQKVPTTTGTQQNEVTSNNTGVHSPVLPQDTTHITGYTRSPIQDESSKQDDIPGRNI